MLSQRGLLGSTWCSHGCRGTAGRGLALPRGATRTGRSWLRGPCPGRVAPRPGGRSRTRCRQGQRRAPLGPAAGSCRAHLAGQRDGRVASGRVVAACSPAEARCRYLLLLLPLALASRSCGGSSAGCGFATTESVRAAGMTGANTRERPASTARAVSASTNRTMVSRRPRQTPAGSSPRHHHQRPRARCRSRCLRRWG